MPTPLKDLYSPSFIEKFSAVAVEALPDFNSNEFRKAVFTRDWKDKELKDRMKHIAEALHPFMPARFSSAGVQLVKLVNQLVEKGLTSYGLEFMFIPNYIETYGLQDLKAAQETIEKVTQFTSCEFAVRPFILQYENDMLRQMRDWSMHSDFRVRRLSSEGSRPRLPWAMALPALKKDPSPILPILETLKTDNSEFVRRSVANNLNDISKDHPELVLEIARRWKHIGTDTDAIIKHGVRTLLKSAHPGIIRFYGLHRNESVEVGSVKILTPTVKMGAELRFQFSVINKGSKPVKLRLEYAMYFSRKNGQLAKKVFKISERILGPKQTLAMERHQSFKAITTRSYYPGKQKIAVVVNGIEKPAASFQLLA